MTDSEIIALARQSERWIYAANQDGDLVVKHLHLNYGVGDLDILAESASPERIHALTGLDIAVARESARAEQDRVQRQLILLLQQRQAASGSAAIGHDTLHPMFDVVRLSTRDRDLLPWLQQRDEIRERYVLLEMQTDSRAPTTLQLHVLGPDEPGHYEGRDAVVRKLIAMWDRPADEGPLPSRLDNILRGFNAAALHPCPPGTGLRLSLMADGTCTQDCVQPVSLLNDRSNSVEIPLPPVRPSGQAAPGSGSNEWLKAGLVILGVSVALGAAFWFLLSTAREGETSAEDLTRVNECARWMSMTYPQKRAAIEPFFASRIESGMPMKRSIDEAIREADQRCVQAIGAQWGGEYRT